MAVNYAERFRRNLRHVVREHPLTASAICRRAGYHSNYVRRVLNREHSNPTILFMECMAQAVDTDLLSLLSEDLA